MKLKFRRSRDKLLRYVFIGLLSWVMMSTVANVLIGSLAWYFYSTKKTITTPMTFNAPFSSDASSADSPGMTMFATSFLYMRLNVSPENCSGTLNLAT
ncbi:TraE/TraK family type IV conjugative transfer system protein [Phytobacter diazotrophicus]|uniref:TraE/TraK family type IV conjugative transfer system protein n=1 Tax=Phytobacter diazotrophicus TaxID=395631 RepID=UPI002FEDF3F7